MKVGFNLLLIVLLSGCTGQHMTLSQLGTQSSFNDVEIPEDFEAPEDEVVVPPEDPGEEILPPVVSYKNTFSLDTQIFQLAHDKAVRWDGCVSTQMSRGGYNSDSTCSRAFFHPSLAKNLNEVFFICVRDAARASGLPEPQKVFVRHVGTYNDRNARNSTRLSHHAYARAWDIVNFNLYDQKGQLTRISTYLRDYSGAQAQFYDEFRDCWRESLPSSCRPGQTEYMGSVGHTSSKLGGNSLHNDHLHLAFPLCAGQI